MTDRRILFSGLRRPSTIPKNYRRLQSRHGAGFGDDTFGDVLDTLEDDYHIDWRDLYYNAETSEPGVQPVNHYRALVNPAWEDRDAHEIPGDREDAVWHIPTKRYTRVAHGDVWWPLFEAISRRGVTDEVFGVARIRRDGGEVHMDVFFEDAELETDSGEDITLGISTGHDYYGNVRLYVNAVAYHDTGDGVGQVMRYLVDPKRRKHTGDAGEDVIRWFDQSVERLEEVSDSLYNIVAEAMHYEMPLKDMPCSLVGFYEHLGLPNRGKSVLADPAGERAAKAAVGPYTAWHLYKAGMWAVEHHYDSRDTSSFKNHVTTVNTLLFNPSLAEKRVLSSLEEEIVEKRHEDDADIHEFMSESPDVTLETIRSRATTISEGVEEFESTRDRIRALLQDEGVAESEPDLDSETLESSTEDADSDSTEETEVET